MGSSAFGNTNLGGGGGGGGGVSLGESSATAYRGDRGKQAFDHSFLVIGNPHNVNKSNVGLSNVDNTTDLNKPISIATQLELDNQNYKSILNSLTL